MTANEILNVMTEALQEVKEYRELGTVEECKKATDKQKPRRPGTITYNLPEHIHNYKIWNCPSCHIGYAFDQKHKYCPNCGQAILWEE